MTGWVRGYRATIMGIFCRVSLTLIVPKVCRRLVVRDSELDSPLKISQKLSLTARSGKEIFSESWMKTSIANCY